MGILSTAIGKVGSISFVFFFLAAIRGFLQDQHESMGMVDWILGPPSGANVGL